MGTMASMAGKSTSDIVMRCFRPQSTPNEVVQPGFVWWSGFICTSFYYLGAHLLQILDTEEAWALVCSILVGHAVLHNLTGWPLDFTTPLRRFVLLTANLPDPVKAQASTPAPTLETETSPNGKQSKKNR